VRENARFCKETFFFFAFFFFKGGFPQTNKQTKMGWADEAEELDDSMLPSYAEKKPSVASSSSLPVASGGGGGGDDAREGKKEETKATTFEKPKSFAALLGGGVGKMHQEEEEEEEEEDYDEHHGGASNNGGNNGGGGGERGGKKKDSGKKQSGGGGGSASSKGGKGGKGGKRADTSSNYNQADLAEDERGLHNDVEVRRRQLQKLNVSKSTRAKDLDTLIACVDLAEPGTGEVRRALKESIFKPLAPAYTTLIKWIGKSGNCHKALEVFECMRSVHGVEPNTYTCSALLNALGKHRMGQEAWEVYEMMKEKNIECNIFTYTALITAFNKSLLGYEKIWNHAEPAVLYVHNIVLRKRRESR
jgi:pentatricopeptide repeat protein